MEKNLNTKMLWVCICIALFISGSMIARRAYFAYLYINFVNSAENMGAHILASEYKPSLNIEDTENVPVHVPQGTFLVPAGIAEHLRIQEGSDESGTYAKIFGLDEEEVIAITPIKTMHFYRGESLSTFINDGKVMEVMFSYEKRCDLFTKRPLGFLEAMCISQQKYEEEYAIVAMKSMAAGYGPKDVNHFSNEIAEGFIWDDICPRVELWNKKGNLMVVAVFYNKGRALIPYFIKTFQMSEDVEPVILRAKSRIRGE